MKHRRRTMLSAVALTLICAGVLLSGTACQLNEGEAAQSGDVLETHYETTPNTLPETVPDVEKIQENYMNGAVITYTPSPDHVTVKPEESRICFRLAFEVTEGSFGIWCYPAPTVVLRNADGVEYSGGIPQSDVEWFYEYNAGDTGTWDVGVYREGKSFAVGTYDLIMTIMDNTVTIPGFMTVTE